MPRLPLTARASTEAHNTPLIVILLFLMCDLVSAGEKKARPLSHEGVAEVWLAWSDSAQAPGPLVNAPGF